MFSLLILLCLAALSRQSVVHTAQGALRAEAGDGFLSYRGIPYGSIRETGARFKVNYNSLLILLCLAAVSRQSVVHTAQGALRAEAGDGFLSYRGIPYGSIRETGARFKVNYNSLLILLCLAAVSRQSVVHTSGVPGVVEKGKPEAQRRLLGLYDRTATGAHGAGRAACEAGDGFLSYHGIPYGSIRETGARFKLAGLAPSWVGNRESERSTCSSSAVEPCLRLDVHVPESGAPWPVLAWVAGAGGPYHPGLLVRQGIIVVVIHHRIGPMGFLCTKEEQIPGNAGAKDVVSALRWVRDNIVAFRGNPANVVVGGQGFGAAIVEGLLLSPMAENLFHGAIMQSGSILSPWAFNYDAVERALVLGRMYTDSDAIASSLLKIDAVDLAQKADKLDLPYYPFGLCVEKAFKRRERFLSEPPFDSLSNRKARSVPKIIGFNSNEGYVFAAALKRLRILKRMIKDFNILLPDELKTLNDRELKQIKEIYFDGKFNLSEVLAYHSDVYFVSHVHRSARLHAASAPVYYYQLSHAGAWGAEEVRGAPKTGAAHGDELALLFPDKGRELDGDDGDVQRTMVGLWTNFVKYLEPSRDDAPRWEASGAHADSLLDIGGGAGAAMRPFPRARASRLWDDLYERHYYNKLRNVNMYL